MGIEISTNISKEYEGIRIILQAPELNEEIQKILNNLTNICQDNNIIIGIKNNEIFPLKINDVIYFFSDKKYNYAKTKEGVYKIKDRMYELEEKYSKNKFIRISSSHIININKTKSFDVGQIGSIVAKMEDGNDIFVSKRKIRDVRNFLNGRR